MGAVGQLDGSGSMLLTCNDAQGLVIEVISGSFETPFLLFVIEDCVCFVLEF